MELDNPCKLRVTEKWLSLEALRANIGTPNMAECQAAMGTHPPDSLEVTFYEMTEIQPF